MLKIQLLLALTYSHRAHMSGYDEGDVGLGEEGVKHRGGLLR